MSKERRRAQQERIKSLREIGEHGLADRFTRCLYAAQQRHRERNAGLGLTLPTYHCGSQFCVYCGWRRATFLRNKYEPRLIRLVNQGYVLSRGYFTIPNPSDLHVEVYDYLFSLFKKFIRLRFFNNSIYGALARAETTFNKVRRDYHPHLETILITKRRIRGIADEWEARTGYKASTLEIAVHIDNPFTNEVIEDAVDYACKEIPLDIGDGFIPLYLATRGKRLVRSYGIVRK